MGAGGGGPGGGGISDLGAQRGAQQPGKRCCSGQPQFSTAAGTSCRPLAHSKLPHSLVEEGAIGEHRGLVGPAGVALASPRVLLPGVVDERLDVVLDMQGNCTWQEGLSRRASRGGQVSA